MAINNKPASELRALVDLINDALKRIESTCASRSQIYPFADEPFSPQSEAARMDPDVFEAGNIIVAAASQLISAVRIPALTLSVAVSSYQLPSCIRVAIGSNVPEILREAGAQGLHIHDIAAKTGVDPMKLGRCLRLLATNHIFREITPDVFANNRASSLMDTGKPVTEILQSPDNKFDGTSGVAAVLEHVADEGAKCSVWLPETIMNKKVGGSQEPNESAFNKAFNTPLPMFSWLELPENGLRLKRFAIGMQGTQNMSSPSAILEGFGWKDLSKNAVIVDVGGGVGSHSLVLAKQYEHFQFVVQDREAVIADATKYWDAQLPEAVKGGRVKLQAHDFFTAQPIQAPAVFLLRMVLHDWSDKYCVKILTELRKAAGPKTQLLVVDNTLEYACKDTTCAREIPGAGTPLPPAPLLANNGAAGVLRYFADVHMMALLNGGERTVSRFQKLFEQCGWKLTKVIHVAGFSVESSKLVAVPM
ncbi:hypothetical protein EIP86_002414 [Pleurotus ostreatoroseus]|nr:hypothetical protein EIP86_002414 [Pleurotus ostreatoroseus]